MFIQTERTPNPETMKFIPGVPVLGTGRTADFQSPDKAEASPLAMRLFGIPGVMAVFLGADFVSVTKNPGQDWEMLKTLVLAEIMQHCLSGLSALNEVEERAATPDSLDDELSKQIRELLDTRVRPAVAADGGDIEFIKFEDGIVYVRMQGACSGCPSATMTLKSGVENMLRHYVPEVEAVEQV